MCQCIATGCGSYNVTTVWGIFPYDVPQCESWHYGGTPVQVMVPNGGTTERSMIHYFSTTIWVRVPPGGITVRVTVSYGGTTVRVMEPLLLPQCGLWYHLVVLQ